MERIAFACVTGVSLILAPLMACADTVSVRADRWYPFNGDAGSNKPGFMIEIAQRALSAAGHTLDYKTEPWERALYEVRNGTIDCVVGALKSDAPDLLYPSHAYGMDQDCYFVRSDYSWRYTGLESLKQVKLGAISGYSYNENLDAWLKTTPPNVTLLSGDTALDRGMKMLMGGRVDVFIESRTVFENRTRELNLAGKFTEAGADATPEPVYIACSPKRPQSAAILKALDEGIITLRKSGELERILKRYETRDWMSGTTATPPATTPTTGG